MQKITANVILFTEKYRKIYHFSIDNGACGVVVVFS